MICFSCKAILRWCLGFHSFWKGMEITQWNLTWQNWKERRKRGTWTTGEEDMTLFNINPAMDVFLPCLKFQYKHYLNRVERGTFHLSILQERQDRILFDRVSYANVQVRTFFFQADIINLRLPRKIWRYPRIICPIYVVTVKRRFFCYVYPGRLADTHDGGTVV